MLKRVNIHLDDDDLKALDIILKKIQADNKSGYGLSYTNRAKLIRYAIAKTFDFPYTDSWPNADILRKALKKALKKAT